MGNTESTPVDYKEVWEVTVGKDKFRLDERQIQVLKAASIEGVRSMIWFEDFAISIPHIQSVYRLSRQPVYTSLPEGEVAQWTKEDADHVVERLEEMGKVKIKSV